MKNIYGETIITIWRFGYFKLFNEQGKQTNDLYVFVADTEWKKLFWRFYRWA